MGQKEAAVGCDERVGVLVTSQKDINTQREINFPVSLPPVATMCCVVFSAVALESALARKNAFENFARGIDTLGK